MVTSAPTSNTRPIISCPGTTGYVDPFQSFLTVCISLWQTPQNVISIFTSSGPTALLCISKGFKSSVAAVAPYAFTVVVVIIIIF